jgi:uncharacterized protein (DUF952 family)
VAKVRFDKASIVELLIDDGARLRDRVRFEMRGGQQRWLHLVGRIVSAGVLFLPPDENR